MSQPTATERPALAKVQKTMMVPEELYRLIEYQERTTGVTFTRQAIAAFFMYFFSDPRGPADLWMEAVIAVENGELPVADVGRWVQQQLCKRAEQALAEDDELVELGRGMPVEQRQELAQQITDAINNEIGWENVHKLADDPIEALLVFWKRLKSGVFDFAILNSVEPRRFAKKKDETI